MTRRRILFAHDRLTRRSGADIVTRDLALGLRERGYDTAVYSPEPGLLGDELRAAGVPVTSDLGSVAAEPDIVHGNHHVETVAALLHFPRARGLFVCHHRAAWMSAPPILDRIGLYVAVDENCRERLAGDYRIAPARTAVIYNAVDTRRFLQRKALPPTPRRALVFSNYAAPGTYLDAVRAACERINLPLDVIGAGAGSQTACPERVLGGYDLVFAKARCALEAMAVGAAVVLCDTHGLGPMVTRAEFDELRRWNFGMRILSQPLAPSLIVRQVERYDAGDAARVSDAVRAGANLTTAIDAYVAAYDRVMAAPWVLNNRHELEAYVQTTAERLHALERELAEFRKPYRMDALSDAACGGLRLVIDACPARVECGATFLVTVALENRSQERIGSFVPYPVHVSYHWFDQTAKPHAPEGTRTPLTPPLPPGGTAAYDCVVSAPDAPGHYRLRVTLVQESVRWLDTLDVPVAADAAVDVVAAGSTASSPA